jgi:hypothetical protein
MASMQKVDASSKLLSMTGLREVFMETEQKIKHLRINIILIIIFLKGSSIN